MSEEPDAPAEQRTEALSGVREDMQKIVQSVQAAAEDLGIELETVAMDTDAGAAEGTPEPAAGPETQQPPAGRRRRSQPAARSGSLRGKQPAATPRAAAQPPRRAPSVRRQVLERQRRAGW